MHESRTAEVMLDGVEGDAVIADKAYDSNAIRDTAKAAGMKAVKEGAGACPHAAGSTTRIQQSLRTGVPYRVYLCGG